MEVNTTFNPRGLGTSQLDLARSEKKCRGEGIPYWKINETKANTNFKTYHMCVKMSQCDLL